MPDTGPVTPTDRGVTVAVRVTAKARRQRIEGVAADADGARVLKLSVTAPPEDGKANAAVVALLAKTWKVPKSAISVRSGAASRRKLVAIAGDPAALARRIEAYLKETAQDG
jgi:uncharacterized protein (TIGR00251 family)